MDTVAIASLAFMILAAALLYSSVGHGGASAYLAAMALFSVSPQVMKPTALALNILVATIAFLKFHRAGAFSWTILRPFVLGSIPGAFIGGSLALSDHTYKTIVGAVLLYSAIQLFRTTHQQQRAIRPVPVVGAVCIGVAIGFLSGLVGVGGGIFLSPLLLFAGWADTRTTAGVSSAFIVLNSIAGLLGHLSSLAQLPSAIPFWMIAAGIGGWVGAEYGSRKLSNPSLRRLLSVVLVIAGMKLIFT